MADQRAAKLVIVGSPTYVWSQAVILVIVGCDEVLHMADQEATILVTVGCDEVLHMSDQEAAILMTVRCDEVLHMSDQGLPY